MPENNSSLVKTHIHPIHVQFATHLKHIRTWLHVLLKCKQQHIHALVTNRHNKAV